jgi:hypothetical protein
VFVLVVAVSCSRGDDEASPTGAAETSGSTGVTGVTLATGASGATGGTSAEQPQLLESGSLEPGTYLIDRLGEPVTITIGEGWEALVFEEPDKSSTVLGELVALFNMEYPAANVAFVLPTRVVDPEKDWDEEGNVLPLPEDLIAWFAEHPMHDAQEPVDTTIGGRPARSVDIVVADVPKNGWPSCGGTCVLWVPISADQEDGPLTTDDQVFAGALDEVDRQIVVEVDGQQLLIDIGAADQESFDAFLPLAEELLATLRFG